MLAGSNSICSDEAQHGNHYLTHLVAVNQSRDVFASEDIMNSSGALVARKGTPIDTANARRIALHKLAKPLELQIEISGTLSGKDIIQNFVALVTQFDDLKGLEAKLKFQKDLAELLMQQHLNPILRQKLTVMAMRQPRQFKQTLLGTWLAGMIARELALPETSIYRTVIAALARDLGMLHLAPELIGKPAGLAAAEWRALQSHVVIGQIILQDVAGMHPDIGLAVLEHHERLDGTGYPAAKEGDGINISGQVLGMADALCSIRLKRFGDSGRHLGDTQPFLLMNSTCYLRPVYDAVCALLRRSSLQRTLVNPCGDQHHLLIHLLQRARDIQQILPGLNRLLLLAQALNSLARSRELIKLVTHTHSIISSSGIINDEIITWLEDLVHTPQPSEIPFLCEMALLQDELLWHLNRVRHSVTSFALENSELPPPILQELNKLIESLTHMRVETASSHDG